MPRHITLSWKWARMKEDIKTARDQRGGKRFKINAPITLFIGDREIPAYTRDLSDRGVYFYLSLTDGAQIKPEFDFTVELPPEITLSTYCQIRCKGRAVRKEGTDLNLTGIAAEILEYSIRREAQPVA